MVSWAQRTSPCKPTACRRCWMKRHRRKLFTRQDDGALAAADHPAAEPVSWALGHDVRPAVQSLGGRACTDCHAQDAPFFFAQVTPQGPPLTQAVESRPMHAFMALDGNFQKLFGLTFEFRPVFKIVMLVASGFVLLVLLLFALRLLSTVLKFTGGDHRV